MLGGTPASLVLGLATDGHLCRGGPATLFHTNHQFETIGWSGGGTRPSYGKFLGAKRLKWGASAVVSPRYAGACWDMLGYAGACPARARRVLGACSAHARRMLGACAAHMHGACSARARRICSAHALGACSAHARRMLGACSAHARHMLGACSAYARRMLGACSAHARYYGC